MAEPQATTGESGAPNPKQLYNKGFLANLSKDEDELAEMEANAIKEAEEAKATEEDIEETANLSPEETTFKKRYGDLRRWQQKQETEAKASVTAKDEEIQRLKEQLQTVPILPKTEEEVAEFVKEHPDVAAIFESMIGKRLGDRETKISEKFKQIAEDQAKIAEDAATLKLKQAHPDLEELQKDIEFHEWVAKQPSIMQRSLYEDSEDWESASRVIDLYKFEAAKKQTPKGKKKPSAAEAVKVSSKVSEIKSEDNTILESDIQKMSTDDYEKHEEEIQKAILEGRFVYDLSGAAR